MTETADTQTHSVDEFIVRMEQNACVWNAVLIVATAVLGLCYLVS